MVGPVRFVQGRNFGFTLNNPCEEVVEKLENLFGQSDKFTCAQWQFEVAPATGTLHVQGFFVCVVNWRPSKVKRVFFDAVGQRPCFFNLNGSIADSDKYTSKEDTRLTEVQRVELCPWLMEDQVQGREGVIPNQEQGRRKDLEVVQEALDAGTSMAEIASNHFASFVRYNKGFEKYRMLRQPGRSWQTEVEVIIGPPGVGKTYYVQHKYPNAFWLSQPNGGTLWFDGYDGQEVVVIDEFYGWMQRALFQRCVDSSPLQVPVKGGMVSWLAKRVLVLSNQRPSNWWQIGLGAVRRRLLPPIGTCSRMMPDHSLEPFELRAEEDGPGFFQH